MDGRRLIKERSPAGNSCTLKTESIVPNLSYLWKEDVGNVISKYWYHCSYVCWSQIYSDMAIAGPAAVVIVIHSNAV